MKYLLLLLFLICSNKSFSFEIINNSFKNDEFQNYFVSSNYLISNNNIKYKFKNETIIFQNELTSNVNAYKRDGFLFFKTNSTLYSDGFFLNIPKKCVNDTSQNYIINFDINNNNSTIDKNFKYYLNRYLLNKNISDWVFTESNNNYIFSKQINYPFTKNNNIIIKSKYKTIETFNIKFIGKDSPLNIDIYSLNNLTPSSYENGEYLYNIDLSSFLNDKEIILKEIFIFYSKDLFTNLINEFDEKIYIVSYLDTKYKYQLIDSNLDFFILNFINNSFLRNDIFLQNINLQIKNHCDLETLKYGLFDYSILNIDSVKNYVFKNTNNLTSFFPKIDKYLELFFYLNFENNFVFNRNIYSEFSNFENLINNTWNINYQYRITFLNGKILSDIKFNSLNEYKKFILNNNIYDIYIYKYTFLSENDPLNIKFLDKNLNYPVTNENKIIPISDLYINKNSLIVIKFFENIKSFSLKIITPSNEFLINNIEIQDQTALINFNNYIFDNSERFFIGFELLNPSNVKNINISVFNYLSFKDIFLNKPIFSFNNNNFYLSNLEALDMIPYKFISKNFISNYITIDYFDPGIKFKINFFNSIIFICLIFLLIYLYFKKNKNFLIITLIFGLYIYGLIFYKPNFESFFLTFANILIIILIYLNKNLLIMNLNKILNFSIPLSYSIFSFIINLLFLILLILSLYLNLKFFAIQLSNLLYISMFFELVRLYLDKKLK